MDWDAIGAVGEIVGAIAVVCSLLYLAAQIRSQSREFKLASVRDLTANLLENFSGLMDSQLADVWARAAVDFDALTESEKMQMVAFIQRYFRSLESAYYQVGNEGLDERIWNGIVRHTAMLMSTSCVHRIWSSRKNGYSEEFQEFIDGIDPVPYEGV